MILGIKTEEHYYKVFQFLSQVIVLYLERPLGANGSYSNVACLSPNGAVMIWDLIDTDYEKAKNIEFRINNFMKTHILPLNP